MITRIISQLIGAGTSVGANNVEANDAFSKKAFSKCIGTVKKQFRETKHFLRMAVRTVPGLKSEARKVWMEAKGLHLIFAKNLEEQTMTFAIGASCLLLPSSIVLRYFFT